MVNSMLWRVAILAIALAAISCGGSSGGENGSGGDRGEDRFFENYKEAIEDAERDGYQPYWLGRSFVAGALTFEGPNVSDYDTGPPGGGVYFSYGASVPPRARVFLDVRLYSLEAWSQIEPLRPTDPSQDIIVADHGGKLRNVRDDPNNPDHIELVLPIGNTIVVAEVTESRMSGDDPELNPLMDVDTFIAVMQELRPYPE